jgi:hypothetical protein
VEADQQRKRFNLDKGNQVWRESSPRQLIQQAIRDGGHKQLISNGGRFKPAFAHRDKKQTRTHFRGISSNGFKLTINVPVVYMARNVMILMRENPFRGSLEGVGPENRDFLGPEMAMREASAIWTQKSFHWFDENVLDKSIFGWGVPLIDLVQIVFGLKTLLS